jgi:hypothetical protein
MQSYNDILAKTGDYDLARRGANADTYEKPKDPMADSRFGSSESGGGASRASGSSFSGGIDGSLPNLSENMRAADLRGQARQSVHDQRAAELAIVGAYRSSIRAQDRGRDAFNRIMDRAQARDKASEFSFDGRKAGNMGEAFKSVRDKIGGMAALDKMRGAAGFDPKKGETENIKNAFLQGAFDKMAQDAAKAGIEKQEDQASAKGIGGEAVPPPQDNNSSKLDKIINIMEARLPIRVLAA